MRAVGNPYEATLYRRTRAERISLMFLFHLTLILQRELQVQEGPCVSVRVRWSGTESYITSVSHPDACVHQAHTLSSHWLSPVMCRALTQKHQNKPSTFSVSLSTHIHTQFNLGQMWKGALPWMKSSIPPPHEEEGLVDHKRIWKQNT